MENPADWNRSPKQLAEKLAPYYMDFIEIVTTAEETEGALDSGVTIGRKFRVISGGMD